MNILYLCTANAARSILAEALTNDLAAGRVTAYSAGSFPRGAVNPYARELLQAEGLWSDTLRSKSCDEFAEPGAPEMQAVITVCDQAAGEVCPVWPGHPATARWGIPDPAEEGPEEEIREAFRAAFARLRRRIRKMLDLPLEDLDEAALAAALNAIQDEAVAVNR